MYILLQSGASVIGKWDSFDVLQSRVNFITKWGSFCYKVGLLLQSRAAQMANER